MMGFFQNDVLKFWVSIQQNFSFGVVINMKTRTLWALGALMALAAIIAEAMGTHSLQDISAQGMANFRIATLFLLFHGAAFLGIAGLLRHYKSMLMNISLVAIALGELIFSITVIIKVFVEDPWWGPVTPIGGGILMVGWLLFLVSAFVGQEKE